MLQVWLRQYQYFNIYTAQPIYYDGPNPLSVGQVIGNVDSTFKDYTLFTDGLQKLSLTWSTVQGANANDLSVGAFLPKKGVSGTLTFENEAYEYIKAWLVNHVAGPLNAIEVKIVDTDCGEFTGYVIKNTDITWCEYDALCTYEVTLKQADEAYTCVQKTLIADNWQGWFQDQPTAGKQHPRFSYCTEIRPNATLVIEWWAFALNVFLISGIIIPIFAIIDIILFIINIIIGIIEVIVAVLSLGSVSKVKWDTIPLIDIGNFISGIEQTFVESAGCGREHPAPLIRDYITNVCDKCGVTVNALSCPVFFAPVLMLTHSDGQQYTEENPYYNACLLTAQVERGVRRFHSINIFGGAPDPDNTTFYLPNNAPVWALSDMLDKLQGVFNSHWHISGATLYFWRKDWFIDPAPLYDFSTGSTDRLKILQGICFEPNGNRLPAACRGLYADDPADHAGHEASWQMNGDPITFNYTDTNPLFSGLLDKTVQFGATKFRLDGASTDYLYDAMQVIINGQLFSPYLVPMMSTISKPIGRYADYALLMQTETCSLPKIIIWDGKEYLNAKALKTLVASSGASRHGESMPDINPIYPTQLTPPPSTIWPLGIPYTTPALETWDQVHSPKTFVLGSRLSFGATIPGVYKVQDYLGSTIIEGSAFLVNYPMYFEPHFKLSLWDRFHWIDDPRRYPKLGMNWNVKIEMCCEDVQKLQALNDGSYIKLLQHIILDTPFYQDGVISEVSLDWDDGGEFGIGKYIEIKGTI